MSDLIQNIYQFSPGALAVWGLVIGMCIGSYMNVVAYRTPKQIKLSWIRDSYEILNYFGIEINSSKLDKLLKDDKVLLDKRSHCPNCNSPIPFYLNIPVFSWIFLLGKSACCKQKISPRYLIIESLFGLAFSGFFYLFDPKIAAILCFSFTILYAISSIDLKIQIIPDPLVYIFLWSGLIYSSFESDGNFTSTLIYVSGTYLTIYLLNQFFILVKDKEVIGMGDAKLLAAGTAWLGIYGACWAFIFSPFIFAAFAIFFKRKEMAFGPSISIVIIIEMILNLGFGMSLNPYLLF